ncbi:hypothetical protein [Luteibacter aegosomatissinici]|uniref:hypothetical protein n=1 Tax=Luteibacter aegosomatissinici TaxID=2911539 RepID=UPI001FF8EE5B|nr:hypothetical protein [Luteibacter aegosomatissinici]UPG93390.1 hypothetical protein L2Y97_16250 [Luteibacter aegosomatissinici]
MDKRCLGWGVLACASMAYAGDADTPGPRTVASVLEETHSAATEIIRDAGGQFGVGAFIARQNAELLVPQLAAVGAATEGKLVGDLNDVQQSFLNGTLNAADDMRRSERYPRKKAAAMLGQADALLSTLAATYRFPRVTDFSPRYIVAPAKPLAVELVIAGHALDAHSPELTVQGRPCELRDAGAEQLRFLCTLGASVSSRALGYAPMTLTTHPAQPWWAAIVGWFRPDPEPVRYTLALALIPRSVGGFDAMARVNTGDTGSEASVPLAVGEVPWGGTRDIALPDGAIFVTLRCRQADGRVFEDTSSEAPAHPWYATTIDLKTRRMVIRARGLDDALAQP